MQSVTLSWEEGGQKEEMDLWDIQSDGTGRLRWAAVEKTFMTDVVTLLDKGSPPLLDEGPWKGFTMATFHPGSTIMVSISCFTQGMPTRLNHVVKSRVGRWQRVCPC